MTRLFLRFYVGVVAILVIAWLMQASFADLSSTQNVSVIEDALAGGVRLARNEVAELWNEDKAVSAMKYRQIAGNFEYPMQLVAFKDADWLVDPYRKRLMNGDVVLLREYVGIAIFPPDNHEKSLAEEIGTSENEISENGSAPSASGKAEAVKQQDPEYFLLFGSLPQFVGPSRSTATLGYGIIFLLAALAIAILLRPVAKQFRAVEQAATSIAGGDLQARIPSKSRSRDFALVTAFNAMAERTESLVRSQRELLLAVSHELRTPLARIRFATDLVVTSKTDGERRKRLDSIDTATEKLDSLVGELLTYARIDTHGPETVTEPVDVWNLIEQSVDFHAPLYPNISYNIPKDPERLVTNAHPDSLARAIDNLVSNAGQYATTSVNLSASIKDQTVIITVEDDGDGIPETERETVFEPFVRLNNEDNRGVGLGLALVQRIAKQHKGLAKVTQSTMGGACLTIQLPYSSKSRSVGI